MLVKWLGLGNEDNRWECVEDLQRDFPSIVVEDGVVAEEEGDITTVLQ